jgi:hypothetical protein
VAIFRWLEIKGQGRYKGITLGGASPTPEAESCAVWEMTQQFQVDLRPVEDCVFQRLETFCYASTRTFALHPLTGVLIYVPAPLHLPFAILRMT